MSLINFKHGDCDYYIVNGYWCGPDWFINCTDDELVIGVHITRSNIIDKTLQFRMRKVLRTLGIKGKTESGVYRDASVFREIDEEGRCFDYSSLEAGICNLTLDGPISVDLNKYIDHGQVIKGIADLTNQKLYNEEKKNVRKRNIRKDD
jgi:hypothetical protein